jgi:hypothetical protein
MQAGFRWLKMFCTIAKQRHLAAHILSTRQDRTRNDSSIVYNRLKLDTHADIIVLGRNCVILSHTGRECDVSPYTETYKAIKDVPIVTGATAWTCQHIGDTYILVFHESLWMGEMMDHTLINPNQLRLFGVQVQDNPYNGIQMHLATEDGDMIFPLTSEGTTIFLPTRTPTAKELHECPHIVMTSRSPWDPHAVHFPEPAHRVEEGKLAHCVSVIAVQCGDTITHCCIDPWCDAQNLCPRSITERLIKEVRVPEVLTDVPGRRTFISKERHSTVTPEELSER